MPDQRYQHLKSMFYAASDMDAAERSAFLDRACGDDAQLRAEIEQLLDDDVRASPFLERPVAGAEIIRGGAEHAFDEEREPLPLSIGRYRILRVIGGGGMGIVYEAEQDTPRRVVALKVVRSGLFSHKARERFRRESEILGSLHHHGIAQIYDAGMAEMRRHDGSRARVPFFAMEKIEGVGLLEYARSHDLGDRSRLDLLARVCDAVHYGHERGVIHRDLKPGNILVDGEGEPKVIDFGVARATDSDVALTTQRTSEGHIVGTLAYMSPEQVSGDGRAVDRRSDVYALGVIGYELLSGSLPYDLGDLMMPEVVRTILDVEPARLSSISSVYRGDIETIMGKALAKESSRRYQSARELAEDIRRYLRDDPIVARPPTLRYRLAKFARRHKELVAGFVMVVVILIGAIVVVSIQLASALKHGETARSEARKATAATEYLRDILASANPGLAGGGRDVRVMDVLDRAAATLSESMRDQPDIELQARWTLGSAYLGLGEYTTAETHFNRALELAEQSGGPDSREVMLLSGDLAQIYLETDRYDEALRLAMPALERGRAEFASTHEAMQKLLFAVATARLARGDAEDAVALYRELVDALERTDPDQRRQSLLVVLGNLAGGLQGIQAWDDADLVLRKAWALLGDQPDHALLQVRRTNSLAWALHCQGWSAEAEHCYARMLEAQRRLLGPGHAETRTSLGLFAGVLRCMGRYDEALAMLREYLASLEESPVPSDLGMAMVHGQIGQLLSMTGQDTESEEAFAAAVALSRKAHGDAYFISHAWWREAVIRIGYGLHRPWVSQTLRWHGCRALDDALREAPTVSFHQDELQWGTLRFTLERWSAPDHPDQGEPQLQVVDSGDLEELREAPEPGPGIYRLSLSVERRSVSHLTTSAWVLAAPWRVDLYRAWRYSTERRDRWESLVASGPHEVRSLPSLCLANWWDTGFGPGNEAGHFALVATSVVDLPPGEYRCVVTVDDGLRASVDGVQILESWVDRGWGFPVTLDAPVTLSGGPHSLRIEHFQIVGDARLWLRLVPASLLQAPVPGAGHE